MGVAKTSPELLGAACDGRGVGKSCYYETIMDQGNNSEQNKQKIVIVEDNEHLAEIYKVRLELAGYECTVAYDGEAALEIIERHRPNLVLLDLMVPKLAGDQILERMRSSEWGKDIRVFIISNLNEVDAPSGLRKYNIEGYAVKASLFDSAIEELVDKVMASKNSAKQEELNQS